MNKTKSWAVFDALADMHALSINFRLFKLSSAPTINTPKKREVFGHENVKFMYM
jgi:hypothetical protein